MPNALDIVVVSQFFTPEMGAPAARFQDFGRLLVQRGHRVTVITGFPNFPSGEIQSAYRGRIRQEETIDGIRVLRGWIYASPRRPYLSKPLSYASFALSASLRGVAGGLRADVVIATSPPPTVAIPGLLTARALRAPLLFDVRDIWPEAIVASGRVKRGLVMRVLEFLERTVYRNAAAITVVTDGKRERLIERGVPGSKVHVVSNGVDLSRLEAREAPVDEILAASAVDRSRFLVMYAGIFGPAQGLDIFFDSALRLRKQSPELAEKVQFVLIGAGIEKERLHARRRDEGLESQIVFVPEQPRDHIPPLLSAANAIAVTLRPRRDTHTVPSKIYESIASGRPVLVSADGAPADILKESGAGFASAASDVESFSENVRRLATSPELAKSLGDQGRAYAERFDRRKLVDGFEELLQDIAAGGRR